MDPRFAIDGNDIRTSSISICFISMDDYSPWWAVELDKHYEIDSIIFQSRKYQAHALESKISVRLTKQSV